MRTSRLESAIAAAMLMVLVLWGCSGGGGGGKKPKPNSAPSATGLAIAGIERVGETLTESYTFTDADGDAEGASTYRWLRDGAAIPGAVSTTYTLQIADEAKTITFEVTPVSATGTATTGTPATVDTSGVIARKLGSAPTASGLAISGTEQVGETLTGSYTFSDADGDAEGASTFRWLRDGAAIPGATATTYVLQIADEAKTITFEVTPVAATGTPTTGTPGSVDTSGVIAPAPGSAPTAKSLAISGTEQVGETLTGSYTFSDVDGDAEGTSTYRWLRDGATIQGATAISYTLQIADEGKTIAFEVTPVSAAGTPTIGTPVSVDTIGLIAGPAGAAPTATDLVITGTEQVGETLTGSYTFSDVDGDAEGASTFRWLRDGAAIPGATATTYTLQIADEAKTVTFEVTPVAATGTPTTGTPATTDTTGVIAPAVGSAPTATSLAITGTEAVGETLTGSYTFSDVDGDAEGASTYRWLRDGAAIPGATTTTYTLQIADEAKTVTFEVTPVAATGTPTTGTPATVDTVGVIAPRPGSAPTASGLAISGTEQVGETLTGSYTFTDADGDIEGASSYRWLRNGAAIPGATATTYVLQIADEAKTITFEVTPVSATGTPTTGTPATVDTAGVIAARPGSAPTASGLAISGTETVGEILTGSYTFSDVDGDAEGASTYRWLRNGTVISGATSTNYTLVVQDRNAMITFEVTPVSATGMPTTGTPATAVTGPVAPNYRIDSDGDGIPDYLEYANSTNHNNPDDPTPNGDSDADSDGIKDGLEDYLTALNGGSADSITYATDSDADGIPDVLEVYTGSNPNNPNDPLAGGNNDADADGIPNGLEDYLTDLNGGLPNSITRSTDSDGDGLPDTIEVRIQGGDPSDVNYPTANGSNDSDGDGVKDAVEAYLLTLTGTPAIVTPVTATSETDCDGVPDATEVANDTDPQVRQPPVLTGPRSPQPPDVIVLGAGCGTGVRYVKLTALTNWPTGTNTGETVLGEVRFRDSSGNLIPTAGMSIYASSPSNSKNPPINVLNGSGLDMPTSDPLTWTHRSNGDAKDMWSANVAAPTAFIVINLGAVYDLQDMLIWNGNQLGCCGGNSVEKLGIQLSATPPP